MAVSLVGDSVYGLVFLFMARKLSGSDTVTGYAAVAQALPFVLFGPLAGVVSDRFDRRAVMFLSDLGCAVVTLVVALWAWLNPHLSAYVVVAAGFFLSTITVFFLPAQAAAVPSLVPDEDLNAANALCITTRQFTGMVGLALAFGVLGAIESIAPKAFFPLAAGVDALTFLISAIFIARLPRLIPVRGDAVDHSARQFLQDAKDGLRAVVRDPFMRVALPLTGAFQVVIAGFMVVYVSINDQLYGGKFFTLGLIEFSFLAVMLVFGFVAGKCDLRRPGLIMALSWLSVGVLTFLMTWFQAYPAFLTLNALCGIGVPFSWLAITVYSQMAFADKMLGRVNSLWSLVQQGAQPIGVALVGPVIAAFGLGGVFFLMGVTITGGCLLALLEPGFRRVETPLVRAEAE